MTFETFAASGEHLRAFIRGVMTRFREGRCFQVASGLTFTTLLSLVPLAMLALTVLSLTPGFTGVAIRFDDMLAGHILPDAIGKVVTRYFEQLAPQARRLTLIGLTGLVVTALLTMHTIEEAFNAIWLVPRRVPSARRFAMYWAVLTLGPILIGASLTITSYVVTLSHGLFGAVPRVAGFLTQAAPVVLTLAAFTLLYHLVPGRRVEARHALIGGVVAGVLFELAKRGFAFYISRMTSFATLYGTFAVVPAFLLWVYLSWLIAIFGAVVTALLPDWGRMRLEKTRPPGIEFCEAVAVLKALADAHARGEVLVLRTIADTAGLPRHRCDTVLQRLALLEWVGRLASERWALLRDPALIRLSDIFRLFATAPAGLTAFSEPSVAAALARLDLALDDVLASTLRDVKSGEDVRSGAVR